MMGKKQLVDKAPMASALLSLGTAYNTGLRSS